MDSPTLPLLNLCLRWIAHDVANPLSAVRSGLEMNMADLAQHGADQLTALTHCLRLIGAITQDGAQDMSAPEDFFKPCTALAQGRDVELTAHIGSLSLARAGLATALALAMIGYVTAGGKIIMHHQKAGFDLAITGLSDQRAHHIKKILSQQPQYASDDVPESADMALYIAVLAAQWLGAQIDHQRRAEKFSLSVKFSS